MTSLEGWGKEFCDDSTKALMKKRDDGGRGAENCLNLLDVIYGR